MKIKIYIQPNAKKSGYAGLYDGIPKIKITAPPVDGAANNEIIKFLSKILNIPKSSINIVSGTASRLKIIEINENITEKEIILNLEKTA